MNRTVLILSLILVFVNMESCKKDATPEDAKFYNTWEVKEFISILATDYPKDPNNKILITFNNTGTYQLKLDVNTCSGTFESNVANIIDVGFPACTEACCDSKFSNKFTDLLPSVTSYSIDGKVLLLNVPNWGTIKLALAE